LSSQRYMNRQETLPRMTSTRVANLAEAAAALRMFGPSSAELVNNMRDRLHGAECLTKLYKVRPYFSELLQRLSERYSYKMKAIALGYVGSVPLGR
jgi:hypothetical protein